MECINMAFWRILALLYQTIDFILYLSFINYLPICQSHNIAKKTNFLIMTSTELYLNVLTKSTMSRKNSFLCIHLGCVNYMLYLDLFAIADIYNLLHFIQIIATLFYEVCKRRVLLYNYNIVHAFVGITYTKLSRYCCTVRVYCIWQTIILC